MLREHVSHETDNMTGWQQALSSRVLPSQLVIFGIGKSPSGRGREERERERGYREIGRYADMGDSEIAK